MSDKGFFHGREEHDIRQDAEPALHRLGLTWEADVEEAYPLVGTTSIVWMKEVPLYHVGTVVTSTWDVNQVHDALKLCLTRWPIFRTIAAEHSETLRMLIALRAQKSYFERAISLQPEVRSVKDLYKLPLPTPKKMRGVLFEGLAFYAAIANVKSTGTVGILFTANHAVYDGLSIKAWATDLGRILRREPTIDRVPYRVFADAYFLYQNTKLAEEARDYHLGVIKQFDISADALWPPGKDLVPMVKRQPGEIPSLACTVEHLETKAPGSLKRAFTERRMSAAIIVKMAICLLNHLHTRQPYAILNMLVSGRSWPFISPDIAALLPHPSSIAGPTLSALPNVTKLESQETMDQLYLRMKEEQREFNQHQHVPQIMLPEIYRQSGGIRWQALRQHFDWISQPFGTIYGPAKDNDLFLEQQHELRIYLPPENTGPPFGVSWVCRLIDGALNVKLSCDTKLFSEHQLRALVFQVHDIVQWICDPGNGEKRIQEFVRVFSPKTGRFEGRSLLSRL